MITRQGWGRGGQVRLRLPGDREQIVKNPSQGGRKARKTGLQEGKGYQSLGTCSIVPFAYRNKIKDKITNNFKTVNGEH